ncbi:hypothetical protein H4S07_002152 [Coemansia furcata]|uniref:Uncharacterized protein n=1 Tax=Coemansia furcata TaxID=417177 RepID=A0ACC1LLC0_9FUNG|nr:hypothetical protein H4S07_002152 [Coemansia furcata]
MLGDEEPTLLEFGDLEIVSVSDVDKGTNAKRIARRERIEKYRMCKRRNEAYATMLRMEGVAGSADLFSQQPSRTICVVNIGYSAEGLLTIQLLESVFSRHDGFERAVVDTAKPYSLVVFRSTNEAKVAFVEINDRPCPEFKNKYLLLEYVSPSIFTRLANGPMFGLTEDIAEALDESRGLYYVAGFISEQEEQAILAHIRDDEERDIATNGGSDKWHQIQERYVKHYGHSFDYKTKHVGEVAMTASQQLPLWSLAFIERMSECIPAHSMKPDMLTIQRYPPGAGISFHVDSHTAFTDTLSVLSLGAPVQMNFRRPGTHKAALTSLDLEPRSLLLLTGEARYAWEHAIRIRRTDLVDGTIRERRERWSITIRKVNETFECDCKYPDLCDNDAEAVQRLRARLRD